MFMEDENKATSGNAVIRKDKLTDQLRHNVTARITKWMILQKNRILGVVTLSKWTSKEPRLCFSVEG